MKKMKKLVVSVCLALIMIVGVVSMDASAAPAPKLKSVSITNVTADENDEVYIEVTEIGTSRNRLVYCNNRLLKENIYETVSIDTNRDRIVDGYKRYYDTGYKVNELVHGMQFRISAKYTNAMSPWNTLNATAIITVN